MTSAFAHPLASQVIEPWWKAHGLNPDSEQWNLLLDEYSAVLKDKIEELKLAHVNEGEAGERRFGMAGAGSCVRKAGLKWLGLQGEPPPGSTRWTWMLGHLLEPMAIAMLRVNGLIVEGSQAAARIEPFMASYADGIIRAFDDSGGDALLSIKTSGFKMASARDPRGFAALSI